MKKTVKKTLPEIKINGSKVKILSCHKLGSKLIKKLVVKDYVGPKFFNYALFDFGRAFSRSLNSIVPIRKRLRTNVNNLEVVSLSSDKVQKSLNNLVDVVNFSSRPVIANQLKKEYKTSINVIAKGINKYRDLSEEDVILVPLRGGALLLKHLNVKPEKVVAIDCKRLPLKRKNYFAFGMSENKAFAQKMGWKKDFNLKELDKKHVRIIEACVVSGMTTIGFLISFFYNNIKPSLIEINTIGLSQQGYELILRLAKKFEYKVKFITGGLFYRLGDFYHSRKDELLTLEGKLAIGDIKQYLMLEEKNKEKL